MSIRRAHETDQKTDQKADQKTSIADELSKILDIIEKNPSISRDGISKILKIHKSSAKRRLETLVHEKKIRREGPDKGGIWVIIK
jgi:predicted HTH transcriptional regulator